MEHDGYFLGTRGVLKDTEGVFGDKKGPDIVRQSASFITLIQSEYSERIEG